MGGAGVERSGTESPGSAYPSSYIIQIWLFPFYSITLATILRTRVSDAEFQTAEDPGSFYM